MSGLFRILSWPLALIVTVMGWPGMLMPPLMYLLARFTAKPPVPETGRKGGLPETGRSRRAAAAYRRRRHWLTGSLLPNRPDATLALAVATIPCMLLPVGWAWPLQLAGGWLWMMGWQHDRRDATLNEERSDWDMRRKPIGWAKTRRRTCLTLLAVGLTAGALLSSLLDRPEPLTLLASMAGLPMIPVWEANRKRFESDLKWASLLHRWHDGMDKPPTDMPPGRLHDVSASPDGCCIAMMDTPSGAAGWVRDDVIRQYNVQAEKDGLRMGFTFDGQERTHVMVAVAPREANPDAIGNRTSVTARLMVDETRACAMYGALPGRIISLKTAGYRNDTPAVWSFGLDGSNADWDAIGRDWLKGSRQAQFSDWGVPDGLDVLIDPSHTFAWVMDANIRWDDIRWDEHITGRLSDRLGSHARSDPAEYFTLIRENAATLATWSGALDRVRLPAPSTILYDTRRTLDSMDGRWTLTTVRMNLPRGGVQSDMYMGLDLRAAFGDSILADVLPVSDGSGWRRRVIQFVQSTRRQGMGMPAEIRLLCGTGPAEALLAQTLVSRACAAVLKTPPLVGAATPLMKHRSWAGWRLPIELAGGVTSRDVDRVLDRIQSLLGADTMLLQWADARRVILWTGSAYPTDPSDWRDPHDLDATIRLRLDHAWGLSGAKGATGEPPRTVMIRHERGGLTRLEFAMPAGLGVETALLKLDAFKATSGYMYVRRVPAEQGALALLAAPSSPLPVSCNADWRMMADMSTGTGLPFAVQDDGRIAVFDPHDTAHLLISGMTQSGKSSAAVTLVCAALLHGWNVYVGDPEKGGGDFLPVKDRLAGFAQGVNECAAMLKMLVEEHRNRLSLQQRYDANSYDMLPDDAKPPRILVFLDEFNSLLRTSTPKRGGAMTGDPDVDNATILNQWEDNLRRSIGSSISILLTQARSQGITVILGAQQLSVSDMDAMPNAGTAKSQLGRLFVGAGNPAGNVSQSNEMEGGRLIRQQLESGGLPKGRALYERMGRGLNVVQCWYAGSGDDLAEHVACVPARTPDDYTKWLAEKPRLVGVVEEDEPPVVVDADDDGFDWSL